MQTRRLNATDHRRRATASAGEPASPIWRSDAALAHLALGEHAEDLELAERFGAPRAIGIALRAVGLIAGGPQGLERLAESVAILEGSSDGLVHARSLAEPVL